MIDKSRFISSMKVSRHSKASLDDAGRPTKFNAKPWEPNQVVLESDDFIYVSRVPVAPGAEIPRMVDVSPSWTLMEEYASRQVVSEGRILGARGLATSTWTSEDLDRALQVACDMGRWDIAYMMVLKTWDLTELSPTAFLWESFPHTSQLSIVSGGRVFSPGGLTKTVLESWWAWQGGYHCPKATLYTDWGEFAQVMGGLRNPYALVGITPMVIGSQDFPAGVLPPSLNPKKIKSDWWWGQGVAYLANSKGIVLPYWFVTSDAGSRGSIEELAWGSTVRNSMSRKMNLPVLIARRSSAF